MFPIWSLFVPFIFGAVVGSFLNVVIWRTPRKQSIIHPPSHCPQCDHRLGPIDLFPLFSFLFLGCKCRYCKTKISWKYFWIELLTALIWSALWIKFVLPHGEAEATIWPAYLWTFLIYALFVSTLIPIFFIDLEFFEIPDELNAILLLLGFAWTIFTPNMSYEWGYIRFGEVGWLNSLIGATSGVVFWGAVAILGRLLFGKDALGHGDIKMGRGIGALLLLPGGSASFVIAVLLGIVLAVPMLMRKNHTESTEHKNITNKINADENEEEENESLLSLVAHTFIYLIWVDIFVLLLPKRAQFEFYFWLSMVTGGISKSSDKEKIWHEFSSPAENNLVGEPTTIPFGPSLAGGAVLVILFTSFFSDLYKEYLSWAFPIGL